MRGCMGCLLTVILFMFVAGGLLGISLLGEAQAVTTVFWLIVAIVLTWLLRLFLLRR